MNSKAVDQYLGPSKQFNPRHAAEGNNHNNDNKKHYNEESIHESEEIEEDDEDLALPEINDD